MPSARHTIPLFALLTFALLLLGACSSGPDERLAQLVSTGQLDRARARILDDGVSRDRSDRDYVLDRMRLALVDLADGWPENADRTLDDVYDILRIQGVNRDNTTASVVVNEDVRYWKGEPFEQALAYHYMALTKGMLGDYGNMRAAAGQSLFLLKDFGDTTGGGRRSTLDIAREAVEDDDYLDHGYTPAPTDFALGHLMAGIANLALDRLEEASDHLRTATALVPDLQPVTDRLRAGDFNTILVVDDGMGPAKTGYGPDNALAAFVPRTRRRDPLLLGTSDASIGDALEPWRAACDLDDMAADHMWNNLEDVRVAKSTLGQGLIVGGAVVTAAAEDEAKLVGLGMILAGAVLRLGAHVDTRHCEVLPQRVFVVPLTIDEPTTITLRSGSTTLAIDVPPPDDRVAIRYARLPLRTSITGPVRYATIHHPDVPGADLPWVMGGRCVRAPSHEVLADYQRAGHLKGVTLAELESAYRAEGLTWEPEQHVPVHVLEGGTSLRCPEPASLGYQTLVRRDHPPYRPKSGELKRLVERERR